MKRALTAVVVATLALAGCGGHSASSSSSSSSTTSSTTSIATSSSTTTASTTTSGTPPPSIPIPTVAPKAGHPCTPSNYYMQCASTGGPTLEPPTLPPLTVNQVGFGIDFAYGGPPAGVLIANGARFGASYLSDSSKDWPSSLVSEYRSAGLGVVFVWEQSASRPLDGFDAGYSDARAATAEVSERYGLIHGVHVDFAADFDSTEYGSRIVPYYQGAQAWMQHLDRAYDDDDSSGAYGGRNTIEQVCAYHAGTLNWQTIGWSGGVRLSPPCAVLFQASINHYWLGHYSADYDYALAPDYGQSNFTPVVVPTICFGRRAQSSAKCRAIRASYAADVKVVAVGRRLYQGRGCSKIELVRATLDQRYTWFKSHLARHPKVETVHRRSALAATGRALVNARRAIGFWACSTLSAKLSQVEAKAAQLEKEYS
jgi:hypothetical protein